MFCVCVCVFVRVCVSGQGLNHAVRLEALRALGSRNLKEPAPHPPNLFGGVAAPRIYRGSKFVGGGGYLLKGSATLGFRV